MRFTNPLPSERPLPQASDPRLLLILDLDETLVFASEQQLSREPQFHCFDYHLYARPGLAEFLRHVSGLFRLAVWTSSSSDYARAACSFIFENTSRLEFIWARDKCTRKWDWKTQDVTYAKHLAKLTRYGYDLARVLVVDDTPEKHTKNHGNLIRVSPFEGDTSDDELHWLAKYLQDLNTVSNVRSIEKRGWRRRYDTRHASGDYQT